MSKNISLSFCTYPYDRIRPLMEGRVRPDGIDLTCITETGMPERQWRMVNYQEFDLIEFSLSTLMAMRSRGAPIVGIPVFPLRKFRHGYMFKNVDKGIQTPKDLEGKKVGLRNWILTAAIWHRGMLSSEYGVDLRSIDWYVHDRDDIPLSPKGFRITRLDKSQNMDAMLAGGEIDALLYPKLPTCFIKGDPRVARIFPDYKEEEIRYYKKTGFFPIMHVIAFKEEIVKKHPWVPREMMKAFQQAKDYALYRLDDTRELCAAWVGEAIEEERKLFGRDPMPYGFAANEKMLNTFMDYCLDHGTVERRPAWDEIFVPSSLDETQQGYISPMV